jgi:uncharacterized membrane protein
VQLYTFDSDLHSVELTGGTLELGKPDGEQTAMGAVLDDLLRREAGKRLAGVILIGDGAQRAIAPRDTRPQAPARMMADLGYPLFTVPLGQSRGLGQARDLAIEDLRVPQHIFVKNQLDVAGTARVEGYVNQSLLSQLLFETTQGKMEVVSSKQLKAATDGERLPINLEYVPDVPGEYKVTLKLQTLPGEIVTTNNEMSTFVTVLKGGLNALYIEGTPRVEQKFIRRSLDASPDIKVDYVRLDAQKRQTRPVDMDQWFKPGKYDVYILGDVDSTAFTPQELGDLAAAVNRGAGLIMLGGLHSFGAGGYGNTPLADALPVSFDREDRQNFGEKLRTDLHVSGSLRLQPTPIGLGQSLMKLAAGDANASTWAALPPLDGANRFRHLKPGAQTLADAGNTPLLVAKDFGAGRVLAFAGDSTWHWWLKGFAAQHKRFWRQTVLWLARKDETTEGNVWVALDQRRYAPGNRVGFTLGARTAQGEEITDALFDVRVTQPGGSSGPARVVRQGTETQGTFLDTEKPGDYQIQVTASQAGKELGKTQARFLVHDQDLELENPAADRGTMEQLASITGGRTVAPELLSQLLDELREGVRKFETETQTRYTLWDTWPFFFVFVGLLISEWFFRKRWGLV